MKMTKLAKQIVKGTKKSKPNDAPCKPWFG
jgi:hypothetical protein